MSNGRKDLIEVRPRDGVLSDRDLRVLRKLYRDSGLHEELQRRSGFDKPSTVRRAKRRLAVFRRNNDET